MQILALLEFLVLHTLAQSKKFCQQKQMLLKFLYLEQNLIGNCG